MRIITLIKGGIAMLGWGVFAFPAHAGPREMGTGIPVRVGYYSESVGTKALVWQLDEATTQFPSDCAGGISLSEITMGATAYKIAVTQLLIAKLNARRIRFFAHDTRDGGCGIDFVQLE